MIFFSKFHVTFYRYDLQKPPKDWEADFHSMEQPDGELGYKNQAGALFFYDNIDDTINAINLMRRQWPNTHPDIAEPKRIYITTAGIVEDMQLLDLSGFTMVDDIVNYLHVEGIDVLGQSFKTYSDIPLGSAGASLFCQNLTMYANGPIFKKLILSKGLDGYCFPEIERERKIYCIFNVAKMSPPKVF